MKLGGKRQLPSHLTWLTALTVSNYFSSSNSDMPASRPTQGGLYACLRKNRSASQPLKGDQNQRAGPWNGMGIRTSELPHIFEPFYRPKVVLPRSMGRGWDCPSPNALHSRWVEDSPLSVKLGLEAFSHYTYPSRRNGNANLPR